VTDVVVAGALAAKPGNGGEAWVRLSWVLGLRQLGVDVAFVEELAAPDEAAVRWFHDIVRWAGIEADAALVDGGGMCRAGMDGGALEELTERADLLVNISGNLRSAPLRARFRRAAYVDLDPGYTQLWHAQGLDPGLAGHDAYFTVGLRIGVAGCSLPTNGIRWRPLPPPVVLDDWPPTGPSERARFTTVGSWRGAYGPVTDRGRTYGVKAHEFRRLAALPERAPGEYELALDLHPADARDRSLLERHGWRLVDPSAVAGTPAAFRRYVQGSFAECSVAQGIYVETECGWFSDRSARYLAAGKPVLVQETGAGRTLPSGDGLVTFRTLGEAVTGAERILADPSAHARAARSLAEEHLDARRVLSHFLEEAL
jgi:hypothetical protein